MRVDGDDPRCICMLAVQAHGRAGERTLRTTGVGTRAPDAKTDALLPHHVRHVQLRRLALLESAKWMCSGVETRRRPDSVVMAIPRSRLDSWARVTRAAPNTPLP